MFTDSGLGAEYVYWKSPFDSSPFNCNVPELSASHHSAKGHCVYVYFTSQVLPVALLPVRQRLGSAELTVEVTAEASRPRFTEG